MFKTKGLIFFLLIIMGLSLVGCAQEVSHQEPEDFYRGKTVIIQEGPSGATTDVTARLFAQHFAEITGATVLVENNTELGGLKSMNLIYDADPDGLTLACHVGSATLLNWMLDEPVVKYDPREFNYIGGFPQSPMALWVKADGPYKTIEDLKQGSNLKLAAGSPLGYMSLWGTLAGHLLGLDFETIIGVGAPPNAKLSVIRGETSFTNIVSNAPGMEPDVKALVLLTFDRHHLKPDVPAFPEIVNLTKEQEDMLKLADSFERGLGIFFVAPPGTSQDKVDYLRSVFDEIAAREVFQGEVENVLGTFEPISYTNLEETIDYLSEHKASLEEIRQMLNEYYR